MSRKIDQGGVTTPLRRGVWKPRCVLPRMFERTLAEREVLHVCGD